MRVIVCGGRDFANEAEAFRVLDELHATSPIAVVVHGGARGADLIADKWARSRRVTVDAKPADWKQFGRAAGPMRNQQMAESGADLCVAFPGGKGTADMCRKASAAGIRVIRPLDL